MSKKHDRFVKEYTQGQFTVSEIWVDQYTGVNYLFHSSSGNAGGLTPLLDCYGRIVVTPTKYNTIPFNDNSAINGQPFNGQFFNQYEYGVPFDEIDESNPVPINDQKMLEQKQ